VVVVVVAGWESEWVMVMVVGVEEWVGEWESGEQ